MTVELCGHRWRGPPGLGSRPTTRRRALRARARKHTGATAPERPPSETPQAALAPRVDDFRAAPPDAATPSRDSFCVVTACAGMEVPIMALELLGVAFRHVASFETAAIVQGFIRQNFAPEKVCGDFCTWASAGIERCDLFMAGFPCQPFSAAGLRKGLDDARGTVIWAIVDFITQMRPQAFASRMYEVFCRSMAERASQPSWRPCVALAVTT